MRTLEKSKKLDSVRYEIRGPVAVKANQMEEEGIKILKLNIGNPAPFGFRAPQNIVDEMPIPARFVGSGTNFILTVHGDSMVNVGINDGDYLIVQESHDASNGEIVVALVNDDYETGATVKRFFKEADHIRLQPENDYMDPIIARDVTVVGKVKGVFRYFN